MSDHRSDPNEAPDAPYAEPLPSKWLPEGLPERGDVVWDTRATRILGALDLEWSRADVHGPGLSWLSEMGRWLRPATVLAAAAAALLILAGDRTPGSEVRPRPDALAMSLVAADGDPVAIWAALGVSADPVLALLTLEDHTAWMARAESSRSTRGDNR